MDCVILVIMVKSERKISMNIKHIQTVVVQEEYDLIARKAFDEKLSLSDFIKRIVLLYVTKKEEGGNDEVSEN